MDLHIHGPLTHQRKTCVLIANQRDWYIMNNHCSLIYDEISFCTRKSKSNILLTYRKCQNQNY